jgi:hypothetical protein
VAGQGIGLFAAGEVLGVVGRALGFALPELAAGGAGCVAVVGGRTEGLFFLVMFHEEDLHEDGEEEEYAVRVG